MSRNSGMMYFVLPENECVVEDDMGTRLRGPVRIGIPTTDAGQLVPADVEERVGPEAAELLRLQFSRLIAGQLLAAALRPA